MNRVFVLAFLSLLAALAPLPAQTADADTLAAGSVRVIHAPRERSLAREVLTTATRPMPLPGLGRGAVPESTTIVLAPTPADFSAATGGGAPEWAGGIAIPSLRVIVLPTYPIPGVRPVDAAATLRHEMAHLVVAERLPGQIPRWFTEGYAEVASGSWDVESGWTLRVAFVLGRAPPLDSLELEWPRSAGRARLAYLLSATMVDHLRRRTGEEGFALLLDNWRREGTLDQAVRVTWGMTMGQLEDEWRKDVRRRYGWLSLAANVGLVWFAAMLLGFLALIPRRRRNRLRMEAMERENLMLPPPREDGMSLEYPLPGEPEPQRRE
ncbi:peptidase MA family metallohydrolase [Longimicrobium sp.]|uniref:peptidase MA family metallohydrolase n=1 Tax=Longimicrobium sp. TaxID=2029185 RepID=UPI003B3B670A